MLVYDTLKTRQRAIRDQFPSDFGLRVHRAISWLGRAEQETEDLDAAFIFYWVAFNAAYAAEQDSFDLNEREVFRDYFQRLSDFDAKNHIYNAVWTKFTGPIRVFLGNQYVFSPFWKYHNGVAGYENWQDRFDSAQARFSRAVSETDTVTILSMLFDRLYVLRNQTIHGGATWNSSVNREQLRDAVAILSDLVPVFIDLMMDNAHEDWGKPFYPVVEG
ncbi:HEPN domain-containing protein [Shimia abyssi]|uniref:Uncharacterized protein n=1 Tax=Shimia abyssi TaxID=1662395 RepID=A0A2P8F2U7_9RHOB|nr:HEPN domain-containing protein [Shimia abyssi]PSL16044.1 hypothetical protein CLV88_12311 [Shimia abyssi]